MKGKKIRCGNFEKRIEDFLGSISLDQKCKGLTPAELTLLHYKSAF